MKRWWIGPMLILLGVGQVSAQERSIEELDLPRRLIDNVVAFFDDPATTVFEGDGDVPAATVIDGPVGVFEGTLHVSGRIEGDVMLVNGDLVLESTGSVAGDVTVLGGRFIGAPSAVEGRLSVYDEAARYGERRPDRGREGRRRFFDRDWRNRGGSRISFRAGGTYNRVEGLPVMVGPVFETRGRDAFRLDALAIWRSERGFKVDQDRLGYFLRAQQRVGFDNRLTIGATAHSTIGPIERWGLTDSETTLSTLFLQRDYRDYYEREGFSVFARGRILSEGLTLEAEYRDEDHAFVPTGDPWTMGDNENGWRPQPLVAGGRLRSVTGSLLVDDRNDPDNASDGWYLEARATFGVGGSLSVPAYHEAQPVPPTLVGDARAADARFQTGFIDLRRYIRLEPGSGLSVRGLLAGSMTQDPLPPQFQHAMGGEGSLPGHGLFSLDCGARSRTYSVLTDEGRHPAFAGYGCDRIALFQAEYRGSFSIDFDFGTDEGEPGNDDWDWDPRDDFDPSWSVFFNSGRGWTLSEPLDGSYLGPSTQTLMDVGVGLFLGDLGLYWAWPLNGESHGTNFFLRLDHRF